MDIVNLNLSRSQRQGKSYSLSWVYVQNGLDEYGKEQKCLLEKDEKTGFTNVTLREYKCSLFCKCMSSFYRNRVLILLRNKFGINVCYCLLNILKIP